MDFPTSPTTGQRYTFGSKTWEYNGTGWAIVATSGSGGTPGGSDTYVQYNNGGSFGGSADFTWNNTTKNLSILGTMYGYAWYLYKDQVNALEGGQIIFQRPTSTSLSADVTFDLYQNSIRIFTAGGQGAYLTLNTLASGTYGSRILTDADFSIAQTFSNTMTFSETVTFSKQSSGTTPTIKLTNATAKWIEFTAAGAAAPAFTTRSAGTKINLWPGIGPSSVDYAIGIEGGTLWNSVPTTSEQYKWYGGTTQAMLLSGTGNLTTAGTLIGPAATTSLASLRLPHGTAPSAPTDGDVWTTTAGMYVRVNGGTVGPLGTGGGGGTPGGADTQIQFNDGGVFGGDADFTWNKTTNVLTLGASGTHARFGSGTSYFLFKPTSSASGSLHLEPTHTMNTTSIVAFAYDKVQGGSGSNTGDNHSISMSATGGAASNYIHVEKYNTGSYAYYKSIAIGWGPATGLVSNGTAIHMEADTATGALNQVVIGGTSADGTGAKLRVVGDLNITGVYKINGTTISSSATDLSYTASTRLLASSTGADVTLPLFTSTDAGLTPLSGGGTTNYLRADGTWAAPPGGSATPGGSTTQLQYNNAGAFGGITNVTTDGTNLTALTVTGAKSTFAATAAGYASINLPHGTAPSSPVNGDVWTTTAGIYAQINGSTVGPLGTGGGGGTPGGSNKQIQFNNSSAFAGAAGFEWDSATTTLSLSNAASRTPAVAVTYGVTTTIDCRTGQLFRIAMTGNISTLTLNNAADGQTITVVFVQDGTGGRTVVWPASFAWVGQQAPLLSTTANYIDVLTATYSSTDSKWLCSLSTQNAPAVIGGVQAAGSNTQVQFNDSGILGASSALTINKTTGTVSMTPLTGLGLLVNQLAGVAGVQIFRSVDAESTDAQFQVGASGQRTIVMNGRLGNANYNPTVAAGDSAIFAAAASLGSGVLNLTVHSATSVGMRMTGAGAITITGTTTHTGTFTVSSTLTAQAAASVAGMLTVSSSAAGTTGSIYLSNATNNQIYYIASGVAAPTFTTRSAGTKIVLYPQLSGSAADYAIGIESSLMWFSSPNNVTGFRWYNGTTVAATLHGTGNLNIGPATADPSQKFTVEGNVFLTGNGRKILGDMSTATAANRFALQTSVTNGVTVPWLIPNGTGDGSGWGFIANSALSNGQPYFATGVTSTAQFFDNLTVSGTGTSVPTQFRTNDGGVLKVVGRIYANGNWNIGTSTSDPGTKLQVEGGLTVTDASGVLSLKGTSVSGFSALDCYSSGNALKGGYGYGNASVSAPYAGRMYLNAAASTEFVLISNGTAAMLMGTGGNIRFGTSTTDPGIAFQVDGNANFGGSTFTWTASSARMRADFTSAIATRAAFQSSTTNGATLIAALPNGTSPTSGWYAFGSSATSTAPTVGIAHDGTQAVIQSFAQGAGTTVPLKIQIGNSFTTVATFNTDFTTTFAGKVIVDAGIQFPATQAASSDVNCLDDYEEGTWTPTDASGASLSLTVDNAKYVKVGKLVTITLGSISWPTNASTADAKIGGLPFTSATGGTTHTGGVFAFASPYPGNNFAPVPVLLYPNSTQLLVFDPVNGVGMQNQALDTTALYGLSMTYIATA